MKLRPFVVAGTTLILAGVNAYLLFTEYTWHPEYHGIPPFEATPRHVTDDSDPLFSLQPLSSDRAKNLKAFGLPDAMVKKTVDRLRDLDDRQKDRITLLLQNVDDPSQLEDAFCGSTQQVRPRYGALRYLVEETQDMLRPIQIDRISGFQRQKWARTAPIDEVYRVAELGEDKHEDATLMAIAALMLKKQDDLLEGRKPFGRGLASTWSWNDVRKQNPGIEDRLVEYFALMHLCWEIMAGPGGQCAE